MQHQGSMGQGSRAAGQRACSWVHGAGQATVGVAWTGKGVARWLLGGSWARASAGFGLRVRAIAQTPLSEEEYFNQNLARARRCSQEEEEEEEEEEDAGVKEGVWGFCVLSFLALAPRGSRPM